MTNEVDDDKLFYEISNALAADDHTKLSELTKEPALEEDKELPDPTKTADSEEDDQPEAKEQEEEKNPQEPDDDQDVADEVVDEKEDKTKTDPNDELVRLQETIKRLEKESHALRSQTGRVNQVQKRLSALDKKLEELSKQQASPSSRPSTRIKERVDDVLKGVRETDSDLADAIAQAVLSATDGIGDESFAREIETIKLIREQEASTYLENEKSRLLEMYPNAIEVVRSAHWGQWKSGQSDRMRALAESDNADDVAYAFERYATDMQKKYPTSQETVTETPTNEQAEKIEAERLKRKTTAAPSAKSPNAAGKVPLSNDPDALFAKFYAQVDKELSGN